MDEKRQRTFRIDSRIDDEVKAIANGGETVTAAYMRVIEAGITAINGNDDAVETNGAGGQLVDALNANIDVLRDQLEHEREQTATYRAQLDAALNLVSQEQSLRLIEAKSTYQDEGGDVDDDHETEEPAQTAEPVDDAEPLTLGRALRCWIDGTPVKIGR